VRGASGRSFLLVDVGALLARITGEE
jgi:hypothetical protein